MSAWNILKEFTAWAIFILLGTIVGLIVAGWLV